MTNPRLEYLEAQRSQLSGLLENAPKGESLTRRSLAARLEEVEAELRALRSHRAHGADVVIAFAGPSVFGSSAIDAEFAATALGGFQKLIAMINAERTRGALSSRGTIPAKSEARLVVTGTVAGSFGFRLQDRQSYLVESYADTAIDRALWLFAAAQDEEHDAFSGVIFETDNRVGLALRDFLTGLEAHEASVTINTGSARLQMSADRVRVASARAKSVRFSEKFLWVKGTLTGVYREARTFEFKPTRGRELYGRMSEDADPITLSKLMHRAGRAYFLREKTETQSRGVSQRYTLLTFEPG